MDKLNEENLRLLIDAAKTGVVASNEEIRDFLAPLGITAPTTIRVYVEEAKKRITEETSPDPDGVQKPVTSVAPVAPVEQPSTPPQQDNADTPVVAAEVDKVPSTPASSTKTATTGTSKKKKQYMLQQSGKHIKLEVFKRTKSAIILTEMQPEVPVTVFIAGEEVDVMPSMVKAMDDDARAHGLSGFDLKILVQASQMPGTAS